MLNYNYFNGLTEKPDFLKRIKSGKVVINFSHDNSIEPLEIKLTEQNTKEYFEQDIHGLILKPFNILLIELDGEKTNGNISIKSAIKRIDIFCFKVIAFFSTKFSK